MAKYTPEDIKKILVQAGIPVKDHNLMIAIAMAESSGNPDAIGDKDLVDNKWDESIGLFQIRSLKDPSAFSEVDKLRQKDKLFDPVYNAKAAYQISKKGEDWTPWSTFTNNAYKKYLPQGSQELSAGIVSRSNQPRKKDSKNFPGMRGMSKPLNLDLETFDENDFADLSFIQAMASTDSDLQSILDKVTSGELEGQEIDEALKSTKAFKNMPDRARAAAALQKDDPATFKALLENTRDSIKQLFIDYGADANDKTINKLAKRAVFYDLKKGQLADIVSNSINFESNFLRGIAGETANELRKRAYQWGVTLPQNSPGLVQAVKDVITQKRTFDDIQAEWQQSAISRMPSFRARFEAGETWRDVANPYILEMESVWELPKGSIGLNEDILMKSMQGVNPKDGSPYAMNLYDFKKELKKDPRWQYTENAQSEILGALTGVLRTFGFGV